MGLTSHAFLQHREEDSDNYFEFELTLPDYSAEKAEFNRTGNEHIIEYKQQWDEGHMEEMEEQRKERWIEYQEAKRIDPENYK